MIGSVGLSRAPAGVANRTAGLSILPVAASTTAGCGNMTFNNAGSTSYNTNDAVLDCALTNVDISSGTVIETGGTLTISAEAIVASTTPSTSAFSWTLDCHTTGSQFTIALVNDAQIDVARGSGNGMIHVQIDASSATLYYPQAGFSSPAGHSYVAGNQLRVVVTRSTATNYNVTVTDLTEPTHDYGTGPNGIVFTWDFTDADGSFTLGDAYFAFGAFVGYGAGGVYDLCTGWPTS